MGEVHLFTLHGPLSTLPTACAHLLDLAVRAYSEPAAVGEGETTFMLMGIEAQAGPWAPDAWVTRNRVLPVRQPEEGMELEFSEGRAGFGIGSRV